MKNGRGKEPIEGGNQERRGEEENEEGRTTRRGRKFKEARAGGQSDSK